MLNNLCKRQKILTFSISPENLTGEKGKGGMAEKGSASSAARDLGQGWKVNPYLVMKPSEITVLADVAGEGAIKHIWITHSKNVSPRDIILRICYDGAKNPAVETPLGDFFANAKGEFHQISSIPVCVNPGYAMNSYFEMPYKKGVKVTLENRSNEEIAVYYQIDCEKKDIGEDYLYFHAQFNRTNPLPYKTPYTIIDDIKGKGQYVGTYLYWGVNNNGWWGEGEIKFYIDGDTEYPSICGTGTEDYFCGAYSFAVDGAYEEYTTPYAGMNIDKTDAMDYANRRFNLYRWHIVDPIYFEKNLKVTIQALGWRSEGRYLPLQDDISSVAFWYSDKKENEGKKLPDRDYLEII